MTRDLTTRYSQGSRKGKVIMRTMSLFDRKLSSTPLPALAAVCTVLLLAALPFSAAHADGAIFEPAEYKGSIEERSQEAIIIFDKSDEPGGAVEDLILKVSVEGTADNFGWVIPFPQTPEVKKEDAELFRELFEYVEKRRPRRRYKDSKSKGDKKAEEDGEPISVISREVVGTYDVAIVRENVEGALNNWLEKEGFRTAKDGDDVISFYREKDYVFACIKVTDAALSQHSEADLHPLRFTFKTGGRDGIYYPMKMTGLQSSPFDVNLYVFYEKWLNDDVSKFGYVHRGFRLKYKDWDSPQCEPDAGKDYSDPESDPFLKNYAYLLPGVTSLFKRLHPGKRYYLTNIIATGMRPGEVRNWFGDLWLFPYYTDSSFVPYDVREGGPAPPAHMWPEASGGASWSASTVVIIALICIVAILALTTMARVRSITRSRR